MVLKQSGVNVSLWNKSHQQFTPCTHPQHLLLANHSASLPKTLRCPLPQASAGGIPQSRDPHQGRASGRRGSGSTDTPAGRKNRLRKRGQINQADPFSSAAASEKGEPLWAEPAVHLPPARAAGSGASGSSWAGRAPRRLPRVPAWP